MSTSDRSSRPARAARGIHYESGRLMVEGVPAEALARRLGTPLYAYSAGTLRDRFRSVRDAFESRDALVCYALKANPNRAVCRLFAREGAGAEVVSGGELRRALDAGFDARSIVFSGVGKTGEEIELGLRKRVLTLNVESEEELSAVSRAAARLGRRAPVSVRVNPGVDAGGHRHIATGHRAAKFGLEPARALMLCRRASRDSRIEFQGLHCHIGSQIVSAVPYRKALRVLDGMLERLEAQGIRSKLLDVGGGMGIRYEDTPSRKGAGATRTALDPKAVAAALLPALAKRPQLRLILEPGRFLTAESGALLTRILYRKRVGRTRFVVVDAAMNDLIRPALYEAHHPIVPARVREASEVTADVVGPVCETGDVLARDRRIPWLPAGEVLAVLKAGAYGFSMASQYNSRPRPAEVLVEGAAYRVIRRRETYEDLVRHEAR